MKNRHRDSGLELFRIITMLLIVAHHYVVNSGLTEPGGPIGLQPFTAKSLFLLIFGAWGKTGINCFLMITGYFMCKSHITLKKFLKLLLEVEFYNIVIYIIFLIAGVENFSFIELIKALLPVTSVSSGFVSCYLLFFLLIPFLNILISNIDEKQHLRLTALLLFAYTILGTIPSVSVTLNYVSWFSVIYFVSSYFRLYPKKIFANKKFWICSMLCSLFVSVCSIVVMTKIYTYVDKELVRTSFYFISDSNKALAFTTSVCAFMVFKNLNIRYNKFINTVAASVFGVLLIHANSDTMRQWLWRSLLDNTGAYSQRLPMVILHAAGSVIAVFSVCIAIDYLRIRFVEKPFFVFLNKHLDKVTAIYKAAEDKICGRLNIGQSSNENK